MDETQLKCIVLLHSSHFALQRVVRDVFGEPGSKVLDSKMVDILKSFATESVEDGKNALENYAALLGRSELVKKVKLEKVSGGHYRFEVDDCVFAKQVHKALKPRDVTCLWAHVAMSLYEDVTGKKPQLVDSDFTETGSVTELKPR